MRDSFLAAQAASGGEESVGCRSRVKHTGEASGIDKPALNCLETGRQDNPTLLTLLRYAHALGKRLVWTLEDEPKEAKRRRTVRDAAQE